MLRNKYNGGSGRNCPVDEHLLSSHAYSDKYGGSTTLLRCASAVVGDHKSSMLDEQYVIPLEDLCPCYQRVHLVAPQPASSSQVQQTEDGATYRVLSELQLHDHSLLGDSQELLPYDCLPMYVSGGFTTRTTATVTSQTSESTRRSFVTFRPQNSVLADCTVDARTASADSCESLDLIKPLRTPSVPRETDCEIAKPREDRRGSPNEVAVGCALLAQSSAETSSAV